ncbi:MAG TPA: lysophospholipid acyltransferase family protein [Bauldia sp.]|nr:lysophospholipid acyltransferase family protein [Bauldia sp.]
MRGIPRVVATVVVLFFFTIAIWPLQSIAIRRRWPVAARLPWYWQRLACFMAGVRVTVEGKPATGSVLMASNHVSWLDISVIGSIAPVSFVAKQEVASWPVVGTLARLQRSVFIDRTRRTRAADDTAAIAERVGVGDAIVLFAEGTTGDGNRMLPFRSALIGAAQMAGARGGIASVQPVAIVYTAIQGLPMGHRDRPTVAWYGDMKLGGHFMTLIGLGSLDVTVRFGEPVAIGPADDRKRITALCQEEVRRMVDQIRRGLPAGRPAPLFSAGEKAAKTPADAAVPAAERPVGEMAGPV